MKAQILLIMYEPYIERRKRQLMNLMAHNQVLQNTPHQMFSFKGKTYGVIPIGVHIKPKLHPDLHNKMTEWLEDADYIRDHERPFVESYIALVLNSSDSAHDWKRLFPEVFHTPINACLASVPMDPAQLTDAQMSTILTTNMPTLDLMRQRMARNLLLI